MFRQIQLKKIDRNNSCITANYIKLLFMTIFLSFIWLFTYQIEILLIGKLTLQSQLFKSS